MDACFAWVWFARGGEEWRSGVDELWRLPNEGKGEEEEEDTTRQAKEGEETKEESVNYCIAPISDC